MSKVHGIKSKDTLPADKLPTYAASAPLPPPKPPTLDINIANQIDQLADSIKRMAITELLNELIPYMRNNRLIVQSSNDPAEIAQHLLRFYKELVYTLKIKNILANHPYPEAPPLIIQSAINNVYNSIASRLQNIPLSFVNGQFDSYTIPPPPPNPSPDLEVDLDPKNNPVAILDFSNGKHGYLYADSDCPASVLDNLGLGAVSLNGITRNNSAPAAWLKLDEVKRGEQPYSAEDRKFAGLALFFEFCKTCKERDSRPNYNPIMELRGEYQIDTLKQVIACCEATNREFMFGELKIEMAKGKVITIGPSNSPEEALQQIEGNTELKAALKAILDQDQDRNKLDVMDAIAVVQNFNAPKKDDPAGDIVIDMGSGNDKQFKYAGQLEKVGITKNGVDCLDAFTIQETYRTKVSTSPGGRVLKPAEPQPLAGLSSPLDPSPPPGAGSSNKQRPS